MLEVTHTGHRTVLAAVLAVALFALAVLAVAALARHGGAPHLGAIYGDAHVRPHTDWG